MHIHRGALSAFRTARPLIFEIPLLFGNPEKIDYLERIESDTKDLAWSIFYPPPPL